VQEQRDPLPAVIARIIPNDLVRRGGFPDRLDDEAGRFQRATVRLERPVFAVEGELDATSARRPVGGPGRQVGAVDDERRVLVAALERAG
jgi:hypothetical protein